MAHTDEIALIPTLDELDRMAQLDPRTRLAELDPQTRLARRIAAHRELVSRHDAAAQEAIR